MSTSTSAEQDIGPHLPESDPVGQIDVGQPPQDDTLKQVDKGKYAAYHKTSYNTVRDEYQGDNDEVRLE